MTEPLYSRLTPTPASRLQPGDLGIGLVDLGDGQPFGVAVTVLAVEPGGVVVRDNLGRWVKFQSLLSWITF